MTRFMGAVLHLCCCARSGAPLIFLHMLRQVERAVLVYHDFTTAIVLGVHLLNAQKFCRWAACACRQACVHTGAACVSLCCSQCQALGRGFILTGASLDCNQGLVLGTGFVFDWSIPGLQSGTDSGHKFVLVPSDESNASGGGMRVELPTN